MYRLPATYACFIFAMLINSTDPAQASERVQIDITESVVADIEIPEGWSHQEKPVPPGIPQTLRLANKTETTTLLMTFLPDAEGRLNDEDALRNAIKLSTERYRRGSVEKTTEIVSLKSDNIKGAYAVFTDASLAKAEKLEPGQFRQVVSGLIIFDGCIATFTLLSDDVSGVDAKQAMKLLVNDLKPKG